MATLSTLLAPDLLHPQSCWTLLKDINGYARSRGTSLTTQARCGRSFRLLQRNGSRLNVQLLEDGYRCWIELDAVLGQAHQCASWSPNLSRCRWVVVLRPGEPTARKRRSG